MGRFLTAIAPSWRIAASSVAGPAHLARNMPCQDCFSAERIETSAGERLFVAAVADGASFAPMARDGAAMTVAGLAEIVRASLGDTTLPDVSNETVASWIGDRHERLVQAAAQAGWPPDDYASTFLAAILGLDAAIFIQIGDGAIAVETETGWSLACTAQHGEYANQTCFVSDPNAAARASIARLGPVRQLAMFSDGLEPVCMDHDTGGPYMPFFASLMRTLLDASDEDEAKLSPALERFLSNPALDAHTQDDKTLILAAQRSSLEIERADASPF